MKNKIVRIVVVFCCLILLVCPLFIVGVSAEGDTITLKAGTYRFNDDFLSVIDTDYISIPFVSNGETFTGLSCDGDINEPVIYNFEISYYNTNTDVYLRAFGDVGDGSVWEWDTAYQIITITDDSAVDDTFGSWFISNTNYNEVNGGSSCPTLQEMLNNYTGTWEEFVLMLDDARLNGNDTFTQGLQADRQYYYTSGQDNVITVLNDKTTFEQFINQLTTYDMTNAVDVLEDHVLEEFNNGIDAGYNQGYEQGTIDGSEAGYRNGYNTGYNKGASDELVGNFFLDLFNAPISILNSIVIYQITDGGTPADTTDDVNITVWGVLVVAVIISLFLILLKIFAGG